MDNMDARALLFLMGVQHPDVLKQFSVLTQHINPLP